MKTLIKSILCILLPLALASCGSSNGRQNDTTGHKPVQSTAPAEKYTFIGNHLVSAEGLPMVVDFSATWCPPCQKMKPLFHEVAEELANTVTMVTIDVDNNSDVADMYDINSIPALVYIDKEGNEVYRSTGFRTAEEIKADIRAHLLAD